MNTATVLIGVVGAGVFIIYLRSRKKSCNAPGPQPIPILGNIHQLDPTHLQFTLNKWYKQYGHVYQFRILSRSFVVISSPEAIHEALVQKSGDFAGRPYIYRAQVVNAGQNDIGTSPYTPRLRALKKEAQKAVKAYGTGLERIESITMSSVEELVEHLVERDGQPIDILPEIYRTVINTLCVLIFGKKVSRGDPLIDRVIQLDGMVAASFAQSPAALLLDAAPFTRFFGNKVWKTVQQTVQHSHDFWNDYVVPHKQEWEKNKEDEDRGVADALFAAHMNTRDENDNLLFTEDNIRLALQNLVVAGSATTTNSLYAFINIMLHHTDVQTAIQQEVDDVVGQRNVTLADKNNLHYTRATIFELLRYHSVNPLGIPHTTTRDSSVQGVSIPEGTVCIMNLWAAHHDEKYWTDPYKYSPERFLTSDGKLVPPDHVNRKSLFAFGAGVRVCMGETLAINRLFLIITTLLQRFNFLPPDGEPLVSCDPREYKLSVLLSPLPYRIRLVPRQT